MKTDLSHLPANKQRELRLIVETITAAADVELIILFGSYARGNWVEDSYVEGHITYEYRSDYDLLVLTDVSRGRPRKAVWSTIEQRVQDHPALKTWVSMMREDYRRMEEGLQKAHYFYSDVYREGIVLYDSGRITLEPPANLDAQARKRKAESDFEYWFRKGNQALLGFRMFLEQDVKDDAAFNLHQAAERFYHTAILVHTGYKPKQHDIEKLGKQAARCDPRFLTVFPLATADDKRRFKLLKNAYIDARYERDYDPQRGDLEWLAQRVVKLKEITEQSCRERIAGFDML